MHYAAQQSFLDVLKLLVEKGGADLVHAKRNIDGFTPLLGRVSTAASTPRSTS